MKKYVALSALLVSAVAFTVSCSSDPDTDPGAGGGGSSANGGSGGIGGSGGNGTCTEPVLGAPGQCPPTMAAAEAAYGVVLSTCGIDEADFDDSDPMSITLMPAAEGKACVSCECRQAIFDYHSVYVDCAAEGNKTFAANLYDFATNCQ